jgi:hypothetical protein
VTNLAITPEEYRLARELSAAVEAGEGFKKPDACFSSEHTLLSKPSSHVFVTCLRHMYNKVCPVMHAAWCCITEGAVHRRNQQGRETE